MASISRQGLNPAAWKARRVRAPHHTASAIALVGGSGKPRPGEISLAHHGVLFLDELPEFSRRVLEVLREPMESGKIVISRAARQAEFPARFQLVAAMNPCPCGYAGDPGGLCHCSPNQIRQYCGRISGPLLDRIDLQVEVPRLAPGSLTGNSRPGESSERVRRRVIAAREIQKARSGLYNAQLSERDLRLYYCIADSDRILLEQAMERLRLSARAVQRILRVACTIADLTGSELIRTPHLTEAISYRRLNLH